MTSGSPGLWNDDQTEAWAKIAAGVHETGARLALRLTHAGRRGATLPRRRGLDRPLPRAAGGCSAPPASPYSSRSRRPEPMDGAAREAVLAAYAAAAARAAEAGFDVLMLDMADGYLLASFLSPLANPGTGPGRATPSRCWPPCGRPGRRNGRWPCACWPTTGSLAG